MGSYLRIRPDKVRKILNLIGSRVARESVSATALRRVEPADGRFDPPPDDLPWKAFALGQTWGTKQRWTYFRGRIVIPRKWKGGAVELRLVPFVRYTERAADATYPAGPEGQVFIDGVRVGAIDQQHQRIRHRFRPGRTYDVRAVFFASRGACKHELEQFGAAWVDTATERLFHDLRVALDVVAALDEAIPAREALISACESAVSALDTGGLAGEFGQLPRDPRSPEEAAFYASVPRAQRAFDAAVAEIERPADAPRIVSVGHAHIDLGWLWPVTQTRHKCARTFGTQCRLLEQFPDWTFIQSQAQAYKWTEQDAPDVFERIRRLVKAGRWEAEGALWCECDMNMPGGESLVRQLLYGKRYFREKFGIDSKVLWLPDVFGYSASLPQLMKLARVAGFVTSKISWNDVNRFPYDTFRWRGIDGSEVPAHFITTPGGGRYFTYNAKLTPRELKENWTTYRPKTTGCDPLLTFGFGDGGGGPTEEMLESASRLTGKLSVGGLPRVKHEKVGALISRIAKRAGALPVWDGELYLEYHRGTYTTQAWLKRANRKNEARLHNVEWLASLASVAAPGTFDLDGGKMDALWEDLMLDQFHDILPGSSVNETYEEARLTQARIAEGADALAGRAAEALAKQIDTSGAKKPVVLFNTLSWERRDAVRLPDGTWRDDVAVPAAGWTVVDAKKKPARTPGSGIAVSDDGRHLSNRFWELTLDAKGRIARLVDRLSGRDVMPKGAAGNEWQLFRDRPLGNDAWDIDAFYVESPLAPPALQSMRVIERGPVRAAVELRWTVPSSRRRPRSTLAQRVVIWATNPRIDFETEADWHEHHQLLKVAFPADVRAREATFEIQFGHVRRPTHRNTSWDEARFEVPVQRFADIGEHDYGLALLNDCKYGCDAKDNVLRLTCIKCAQSPDELADQGRHEFTYSLLPHAKSFQEAGVVRAAAELNAPVLAREAKPRKGALAAQFTLVECSSEAVVIDTIKPAEDRKGLILRLYEAHGSHADATLTFGVDVATAERVNLLEERLNGRLTIAGGRRIELSLKPFEVVSLRVRV